MKGKEPTRRDVMIGLAGSILAPLKADAEAKSNFQVFDALLYRSKPDLTQYGLRPLPTLYNLWRPDSSKEEIDELAMKSAMRTLPQGTPLYFIDIEHWPLLQVTQSVRDSNIGKLMKVAQMARVEKPGSRFGFYNLPPIGTYWPIVLHDSTAYPQWLQANRALDPLAARVDVLFPSLYTFYDDSIGWKAAATAILAEARRYGRDVYPFLWFEFHDSNPDLAGKEIPSDFWTDQLQFCQQHADGVVLWGGYRRKWDNHARWWQTTLRTLGLGLS